MSHVQTWKEKEQISKELLPAKKKRRIASDRSTILTQQNGKKSKKEKEKENENENNNNQY